MKHTVGDLLAVVYRYYPRGMNEYDPGYRGSEEHRRLVQVRVEAGAPGNSWRVLRRRIAARFPGMILQDGSSHLPTGHHDAGYAGWLHLPPRGWYETFHAIGFLISFLVPYYVVYSVAVVIVPAARLKPLARYVSFDFTPDEESYAAGITEEILSVFPGYEPMPPEIGKIKVPDAVPDNTFMGEATLYDCLFRINW